MSFAEIFGSRKLESPVLSCVVVCVILRLSISVEHRLVTARQTHDYGIYRANTASRGKKTRKPSLEVEPTALAQRTRWTIKIRYVV